MRKFSLLILMVFSLLAAKSQVTYTMSQIPYAPDPYNGGTSLGLAQDDIYSGTIPIGFTFSYFGINYDSIVVSTNGSVNFDHTKANTYCQWQINGASIPNSTILDLKNSILSPFQDLNPAVSNLSNYQINTQLLGIAPYRRLVISFDSVSLFQCNTVVFSNQVVLYETTYYIDINIKDKLLCPSWNGGSAILGIQDSAGIVAYSPPGRNGNVQWTASQESWRFIPSNAGPVNPNSCKIKGNIFFDGNSNCTKDAGEYGNMNRYVLSNVGNYYAYSDVNGDYEMLVDTGSYIISHNPYGNVSVLCPPSNSYNVAFSIIGDSINNINFGDSTQICSDLYSTIGVNNLRFCHQNLVTVPYGNVGSIPELNAVLTVTIPDSTYASNFSITPTSNVGNTYMFNLGTLYPGQMSYLTFKDSLICDTTWIGTSRCLASSISGTNTDCDATNNAHTNCYIVVASYDPNSIEASVSHIPQSPFVTNGNFVTNEWITYKIGFQNTGTASALNILVKDVLDASKVDISTVEFIGSSHIATMIVNNNQLDFHFDGINLIDSNANEPLSHGWLTFRVKSLTSLNNGSILNNVAGIFFDNNPVVNTNTCILTINMPSAIVNTELEQINISPNPMTESTIVKLSTNNKIENLELISALGEIVLSKKINSNSATIFKNQLPIGNYIIKITTTDGKTLNTKLMIK